MDWGQLVARYKTSKAAKKAMADGWVQKRKIVNPQGKKVTGYACFGMKGVRTIILSTT